MNFQELFDNRKDVAIKLKRCIREMGYTKVSFSKKTGISRPTIDRLLSAEIDNRKTFEKHIKKIFSSLDITENILMQCTDQPQKIDVVYSQNAPTNFVRGDKAQKQYALLLDLVDLCSVYY